MTRKQEAILINLLFSLFLNVGFSICSIYYLGDNAEDWIGVLLALFFAGCQAFMGFLILSIYDMVAENPDFVTKTFYFAIINLFLPFFFIAIAFVVSLYFTAFTYILVGLYLLFTLGYWWASRWVYEKE